MGNATKRTTNKRIIPSGNRLLVRKEEKPTRTPGGIEIVSGDKDESERTPFRAEVLEIGAGYFDDEEGRFLPIMPVEGGPDVAQSGVNVGDIVILPSWAEDDTFDHDGEKLIIVDADAVFGVEQEG